MSVPTIITLSLRRWGPPGQAWVDSDPIADIRTLQDIAAFRPVVFMLSPATARVFIEHVAVFKFAKAMDAVDVFERRSRKFTFRGLCDFEVVDGMPDGVVSMVSVDSGKELARLEGAIGS